MTKKIANNHSSDQQKDLTNLTAFTECLEKVIPYLTANDIATLNKIPNKELHQKIETIMANVTSATDPDLQLYKDGRELKKLYDSLQNVSANLNGKEFFGAPLPLSLKIHVYAVLAVAVPLFIAVNLFNKFILQNNDPNPIIHSPDVYTEKAWTALIGNLKFLIEKIQEQRENQSNNNKNPYASRLVNDRDFEKLVTSVAKLENITLNKKKYEPSYEEAFTWEPIVKELRSEIKDLLASVQTQLKDAKIAPEYHERFAATPLGFFQKFAPSFDGSKSMFAKVSDELEEIKTTIKNYLP